MLSARPVSSRDMETINDLYRRLAIKYHPDTLPSVEDKALFEELMVEINIARDRGDLSTLQGIENLGPVYIAVRNYERVHRAEREARVERGQSTPQAARPTPTEPRGVSVTFILRVVHPYALWRLMESWNDHGALNKLSTVAASLGWLVLSYTAWRLLDEASRLLAQNGFGHESVPGLIIVLLRGALIMVSLPCVLPTLLLAFIVGLFLVAAWLCSAIASAILGYFHPLLGLVPPWIMGALLVMTGWSALKKQ